MADEAGMPGGDQTAEEEAFIHKKAFAVINCFLDSEVPPRVQVAMQYSVLVNKRGLAVHRYIYRSMCLLTSCRPS